MYQTPREESWAGVGYKGGSWLRDQLLQPCMLWGSTCHFCPSGVGLVSWMLLGGMCVCSQRCNHAAVEV